MSCLEIFASMFPGMRRGRQGGFALFLLFAEIMRFGFDRIPPITLITLGFNVAVFMRLIFPLVSLHTVCISVETVWYYKDWTRLILAGFFHSSDWHLYYNMVSLIWKGSLLERKYGTFYYAYILVVFTPLIHVLLVAMNLTMYEFTHDSYYVQSCAVGFSGVLFALKVLVTHNSPAGTQYVMGIVPVPSKWIFWAELLLIQLLVPNASFVGHLAGICVGLAFVKGPLKTVMDLFAVLLPTHQTRRGYTGQPSYTYHASRTGLRASGDMPEYNRSNYSQYTAGMTEEEQVQWAINNSARNQGPGYPSSTRSSQPASSAPYPESPSLSQSSQPASSAPYPESPSLSQSSQPASSAPYPETPNMPQPEESPHETNRLYPNLPPDMDDLRQRRMMRFT